MSSGCTGKFPGAGVAIGPVQAKKKLANLYDYLTEDRQSFGR
jgi:hypothetical protein